MVVRKSVVAYSAVIAAALVATQAQAQAAAPKKIGVLIYSDEGHYLASREAALKELAAQGFAAPAVQFVSEDAGGNKPKSVEIAKKMAAAKHDLYLVFGTSAAIAVATQVKDAPVIFGMVYNPVESKIANDWKSSGNNTTGTSSMVEMATIVATLKRLKPTKTIGVLYTPGERNSEQQLKELTTVQAAAGVKVVPIALANKGDVDTVAPEAIGGVDAVYFTGAMLVSDHLPVLLATTHKAKAVSVTHLDSLVNRGVMLGVIASAGELGKITGRMAAQVLKGAAPSSIAIEALPRPDVVINKKSLAEAGLKIPAELQPAVTRTIP